MNIDQRLAFRAWQHRVDVTSRGRCRCGCHHSARHCETCCNPPETGLCADCRSYGESQP